ncbi:MAG: hypothetical protein AAGF23_24005, partial [Acidobacteriota bacterium]
LAAAHLAFSLWGNEPGYLTYDSGTYHFMVKTLAETGGFVVDNGYGRLPSVELIVAQLRAPRDVLVAQYPEAYTFLALPFYWAMGYPGLLFLNALAFVAIVLVIYRLSMRLFGEPGLAFMAMAVYAFATYAWEWSHGVYPHLSSTLLLLVAVDGVAKLLFEEGAARRWGPALVAGLLVGLAAGLRLDSIFVLPALTLPLLLAAPVRWRALGALGLGLVPGFVLLSVTNRAKFGTFNPFSYGIDGAGTSSRLSHYMPAAVLGLGLCLALVIWRRRIGGRLSIEGAEIPGLAGLAGDWRPWLAAVLSTGALAAAVAPGVVGTIAHGLFQIVVDMRTRPEISEPALARSSGGAMVYMGGVKKSLLQSLPYLALLYVPLVAAWRGHRHGTRLLFLLFLPLPFIGVFGSLAWHGSVALNMRYLNPILPCTSILVAWLWCQMEMRPGAGRAWTFAIAVFAVLCLGFAGPKSLSSQELLFLTLPLVLGAGLVALELAARFARAPRAEQLLPWGLLVAFAFAGALTFSRDYPTSAAHRSQFMEVTRLVQPHLESPAIFFCDWADVMWGLLDEVDDIYLARPANDAYATFSALTDVHRADGRRAYLLLPKPAVPAFARRIGPTGLGLRLVAELPPVRLGHFALLEVLSIAEIRKLQRTMEPAAPPPPSEAGRGEGPGTP